LPVLAGELALDVGVVILIAALMFTYFALVLMEQLVRAAPVVGGYLGDRLGSAAGWVSDRAHDVESFLWSSLQALWHALQVIVSQIAAGIGGNVQTAVVDFSGQIRQLYQETADLYNRVQGLSNEIVQAQGVFQTSFGNDVRILQGQVGTIRSQIDGALFPGIATAIRAVEGIEGEVGQIRQQIGSINDAVFGQELLQRLTQVEGQVGAMTGVLSDVRARVGHLEIDLERLAPLAVIAGAGAIAIENLVKVGEDPCFCLTQGDGAALVGIVDDLYLAGA
jgi:hypothetical protein